MDDGEAMKELLNQITDGHDLTHGDAQGAMRLIMGGSVGEAPIAAFLTGLRMKGETIDEITACAQIMREYAHTISPNTDGPVVDVCGTGGAQIKTFNISTIGAFVVAGAGVTVAKHGNRSSTGACGSADVLEALGADIMRPPADVEQILNSVGIAFLFAQVFHPAMKHVAPVRRAIGIRTIFNMLGPLTNPATATRQSIGVYAPSLVKKITPILPRLGIEHGLVFHGLDGLDELSTFGESLIGEVKNGECTYRTVKPGDFGLETVKPNDLAAEAPAQSAATFRAILEGCTGPRRDAVLLNAGAALYVAGRAPSVSSGIDVAAQSIDSGAALKKLDEFIAATRTVTHG